MKFNLWLTSTFSLTVGKYTVELELSTIYWRIYKRFDRKRGLCVLHFGPLYFSIVDDEKTMVWLESLVAKSVETDKGELHVKFNS